MDPKEAALLAEVDALRAAWQRALATGAAWSLGSGVSGSSHNVDALRRQLRDAELRLARYRQSKAGLHPLDGGVA